jgi:hypothetical protein
MVQDDTPGLLALPTFQSLSPSSAHQGPSHPTNPVHSPHRSLLHWTGSNPQGFDAGGVENDRSPQTRPPNSARDRARCTLPIAIEKLELRLSTRFQGDGVEGIGERMGRLAGSGGRKVDESRRIVDGDCALWLRRISRGRNTGRFGTTYSLKQSATSRRLR